MYGTDQAILTRHGLHCGLMVCRHPLTGERLRWQVPLPPDMAAVWDTMTPLSPSSFVGVDDI